MKYYANWHLERMRESHAGEFDQVSVPEREASLFLKVLQAYPLHIHPGDQLAGWYGFESEAEMECLYTVPVPPRQEGFAENSPVWWLWQHGYGPGSYDRVHHEIDYRAVLSGGINAWIEKVNVELKNPDNSPEKNDYLHGMAIALRGAELFAHRFANLAQQKAELTDDAAEKARLLRMAQICRKVPMEPPEDFQEALQAAYLLRALCGTSSTCCVSASYGSFDQYMYPYYLVSRQKGVTDEQIIDLLLQFFRMLDNYDGNDCTLSVGGVDENGNDATNALSYLLVQAEKRSHLRAPLFAARINKNTPREFMRELVSRELFEMGQPSFYSEESCLAAMETRGIAPDIAKKYQISTCMNIVLPHGEASHGWGCIVNTHLPLELTLCGGKPLTGELPIPLNTPPRTEYTCVDEIFTQYNAYAKELFDIVIDWIDDEIARQAKIQPDCWMSALTEDCIGRGKDRWDGGALYHNLIIETFALADTADAITAIDQLVFTQKKYTISDLIEAARADYQGCETLRRDILRCDKYGMGISRADENICRLAQISADICQSRWAENRRYLPSLHTLWSDVFWGKGRPAFLNGRRAGEPIAKNAGPSTAARKAGPTNLILSAGSLDQARFSGGQALDVHIGIRNLDSTANRDKIAALIQTYFQMGGLQMQVNGLSVQTLKNAYADPGAYPDLIVRIGGHSRYFNDLDNDMKQRFIERFEVEEGAFA